MANQYDQRRRKIERDRMLAEAIRQTGNEPLDTTKMAGRFVVPVSNWEHAAKLTDKLVGGYMGGKADRDEKKLEAEQQAAQAQWVNELPAATTPDELQPIASTGELIEPDMSTTIRNRLRQITAQAASAENNGPQQALEEAAPVPAPMDGADPQQVFQRQQQRQLSAADTFARATDASQSVDRQRLVAHAMRGGAVGGVPERLGEQLLAQLFAPSGKDTKYQDLGDRVGVFTNGKLAGYLPKGASPDATENRKAAEAARRQGQEFTAGQSELSRRQAAEIAAAGRAVTTRGQEISAANAAATLAGGKVTDTQRTAKGYHDRMAEAEKVLPAAPMSAKDWAAGRMILVASDGIVGSAKAALANSAMSDAGQKALQAQMDWVRSKLRKESGAVIAPQEMLNEISTYFAMPGDSAGVIKQKKKARATAVNAMREQSGNAGSDASDDGWSATETK